MERFVELILRLITFAAAFGYSSISQDTCTSLAVIVFVSLLNLLSPWFKRMHQNYQSAKITKDLAPYFDKQKVRQSIGLYIPS
ncbi:MAG: hypothetical protein U1C46_11570, partial [Bacteroidales bacterium]|nr:hypothetical protein [Bacteroidales bacterium]